MQALTGAASSACHALLLLLVHTMHLSRAAALTLFNVLHNASVRLACALNACNDKATISSNMCLLTHASVPSQDLTLTSIWVWLTIVAIICYSIA